MLRLPAWLPTLSGTMVQNHLLSLICLLLLRAVVLIFALSRSGIGLGPDEAQYWLWSRHLDWAYYSKPPGIAWEILLGTHIFGDSLIGVRSVALILGSLLPIGVYFLAICSGLKPTTAFWAGVVMAVCPAGVLGSFFATTDIGYVLCWTFACVLIGLALRKGERPNYRALGAILAVGALFKWPIYTFWLLLAPFSLINTRLRSWTMLEGIAISALGLIPSLVWNSQHEWVTFRHVWTTITGGPGASASVGLFRGNFIEFLGAQVALLSPIFFLLLLGSTWILAQRRRRLGLPLFFCGYITVTVLGFYLIASLFLKIQGNWAVYAYPTGVVLLSWYACEWLRDGKTYLFLGGLLSFLLTLFAFSIPTIQSEGIASSLPIPYSFNPFRTNMGWENLEEILKEDGYDPSEHFLASDRYQTSAILSRHSEGHKRSYILNLGQSRKNQFSIWPSLVAEQKGRTGYFVFVDERNASPESQKALIAEREEQLSDYFRSIQFVGQHPLFHSYGKEVKRALVFRCCDYNCNTPADPDQY